jgi:hypothetical protein
VSADLELESWRQAWSVDTEPLPELKRRVRAQNRRLVLGLVAMACVLVIATAVALRQPPGSGWRGFAVGVWAASAVGGAYALWARRGTWEPSAQTTEAYVDVLRRRAVAELRKLVFLRRCLLVVLVGYTGWLLWKGWPFTLRSGVLVAMFALEGWWMGRMEKRRRRDVDAAAALAKRVSEDDGGPHEERIEQP